MFKLTWKQIIFYKKPGIKKRFEKIKEHEATFISKEACENAIAKTPPEHRCYDFLITKL